MDFSKFSNLNLTKYRATIADKEKLYHLLDDVLNSDEIKNFNPLVKRNCSEWYSLISCAKKKDITPLDEVYFTKDYSSASSYSCKWHLCKNKEGLKKLYRYDNIHRKIVELDYKKHSLSSIASCIKKFLINGKDAIKQNRIIKDSINKHNLMFNLHKYVITESDNKFWFFDIINVKETYNTFQITNNNLQLTKFNCFLSQNQHNTFLIDSKNFICKDGYNFLNNGNKIVYQTDSKEEFLAKVKEIYTQYNLKHIETQINKFISNF